MACRPASRFHARHVEPGGTSRPGLPGESRALTRRGLNARMVLPIGPVQLTPTGTPSQCRPEGRPIGPGQA